MNQTSITFVGAYEHGVNLEYQPGDPNSLLASCSHCGASIAVTIEGDKITVHEHRCAGLTTESFGLLHNTLPKR